MVVKVVGSLAEFHEIIKKGNPTVFDFWATWCGPCRMISPIFEKFSEKAAEENSSLEFYKVDVDAVPDVAEEVGIKAMPTFMVFKESQKVEELVGANPSNLANLIAKTN
ncbi:hypothetical protein M0805_002429 [Coniferiporia weirii]|nr:hypothetical protein M0805_002429 [Coniferiporia weirii]